MSTFVEGEKCYQNSQETGTRVPRLKGGSLFEAEEVTDYSSRLHRQPLFCALIRLHHCVPTQGLAAQPRLRFNEVVIDGVLGSLTHRM